MPKKQLSFTCKECDTFFVTDEWDFPLFSKEYDKDMFEYYVEVRHYCPTCGVSASAELCKYKDGYSEKRKKDEGTPLKVILNRLRKNKR